MKLLSIAYIIVNIILFCSLCEKKYIFFSMGETIIRSKKKEVFKVKYYVWNFCYINNYPFTYS